MTKDPKFDIAVAGMECMAGWAAQQPKWWHYLIAALLLSPMAYDLISILST